MWVNITSLIAYTTVRFWAAKVSEGFRISKTGIFSLRQIIINFMLSEFPTVRHCQHHNIIRYYYNKVVLCVSCFVRKKKYFILITFSVLFCCSIFLSFLFTSYKASTIQMKLYGKSLEKSNRSKVEIHKFCFIRIVRWRKEKLLIQFQSEQKEKKNKKNRNFRSFRYSSSWRGQHQKSNNTKTVKFLLINNQNVHYGANWKRFYI